MASLFQFSIRSLLVGVTIAAVGIAALLNANTWWEGGAWAAALFLLGCAILLATYRREEQRAYWFGFAIFGGLYLAAIMFLTLCDWFASISGAPFPSNSIVTARISEMAYYTVIPESRRVEYVSVPGAVGQPPPFAVYSYAATTAPSLMPPPPAYSSAAVPLGAQIFSVPPPTPVAIPANASYVPLARFVSISHALWLLLVAAVGGKVCQWIYRTRPAT